MNLFENVPSSLPKELCEALVEAKSVRIERIVSLGHASAKGFWYDQDASEWVLLLSGGAGLEFEGREDILEMKPGDHVNIAAHVRHRVAWTIPGKPTLWLAVHYQP